jgi:hypothetical protein
LVTFFLSFSSAVYWYMTTQISLKTVFVFRFLKVVLIWKVLQSVLHVSVLRCRLKILTESLEELVALFDFNAVLKNRKYRTFLVSKTKLLINLSGLIHEYSDQLNQYFGYPIYGIIESNSVQILTSVYWAVYSVYNHEMPIFSSISEYTKTTE